MSVTPLLKLKPNCTKLVYSCNVFAHLQIFFSNKLEIVTSYLFVHSCVISFVDRFKIFDGIFDSTTLTLSNFPSVNGIIKCKRMTQSTSN